MAIFHCEVQMVKRSEGRSAVTAAAYRAGEKLNNERRATEDDYTKKTDVAYKKIFLPEGASEKFFDRGTLWNAVEESETRKDAQLARELNIALPNELTPQQQTDLIEKFVQEQFVNQGMIADVAIHRPKPKKKKEETELQEEGEPPQKNDHAHVMLTTRIVSGEKFLGKNRDWNGREPIRHWREEWAKAANAALEAAGSEERIDHRSLAEQGIDREAQIHEGFAAREIERRAPGASERVRQNREIKQRNAERAAAQKALEEKLASARMNEQPKKNSKPEIAKREPVALPDVLAEISALEKSGGLLGLSVHELRKMQEKITDVILHENEAKIIPMFEKFEAHEFSLIGNTDAAENVRKAKEKYDLWSAKESTSMYEVYETEKRINFVNDNEPSKGLFNGFFGVSDEYKKWENEKKKLDGLLKKQKSNLDEISSIESYHFHELQKAEDAISKLKDDAKQKAHTKAKKYISEKGIDSVFNFAVDLDEKIDAIIKTKEQTRAKTKIRNWQH